MSKTTRATQALSRAAITHSVHAYDYDPEATRIGLQAAEAMGVPPGEVFKTLMATVDGKPVCVLVPSDREVSLKRLAAAFAGKSAAMMRPAEAERLTGYHVGGISPLGQKRAVPTLVDSAALALPEIFVNGGQRGLQLRLKPADLVRVLQARTEAVT
ncbi:prolyl-tRNA synthetase [Methylobacterium variabile]|jgi:Cys-tRNA(Pro)/Cys-tRNA(Cys) deacylase|uniref:Cys-tRNA(Pro)/Cys-tRNA(Cys) deacylase n=1 Tax=Methylobacterium variabile TaxID=298794 RepID=A0A0J6VPA9_9HYPH|nr:Cys-tRNA(Pro) deacylase [Methylobacterium variabile]KMO41021.1 prolyl-tRNA synthetase [Methylobacterium variabile]